MLSKIKGYRTIALNVLAVAGAIGTALAGVELDQGQTVAIVTGLAAANAVLRIFTNTPAFKGK